MDLLWDNYNGLFTGGFSPDEVNPPTSTLNSIASAQSYDAKIIAYAGYIATGNGHDAKLWDVAQILADSLAIPTDGIVPTDSAWFQGRLGNSQLRFFADYDHYQMMHSKTTLPSDPLFTAIGNDLAKALPVISPPAIAAVVPSTLQPSSSPQMITITGSNFQPSGPNASTLVFYDPANNPYARTPYNLTATSMQYDLNVQSATGTWKVKVVNGNLESSLYSFTVASVNAQLLGLSISGPENVNQNTSGNQYTANAIMSDGSTPQVSVNWSLSAGAPGNVSSSGQLTANGVGANTQITVMASYSYGGVTKTANYNVTIVASSSCGSYVTNVVSNGDFESGSTGWTLSGGAIISTTGSLYHSATHYLWLGGDNGTDSAYYQATIPSSATSATLSLYENINSSEPTSLGAYDTFSIVIRDTSGNLLGTVASWSNLNGTSPGNYQYQTFNLLGYAGKTIRIYFVSNCHLSGSQTTNFRVDDIGLILALPNPPTPVLFGVGGPTSVAQGTTAQYSAIVVNCDNSIVSVSPSWSISSGPASISASGLLTAGSVSVDTPATVTASYPGFAALNYNITIAHVAPVFTSLAINGPNSVNENGSGQFTASALYSDGSSQVVTPNWSIASGPGGISASGLFTVGSVVGNTTTTLSATYTIGGITHNAGQQVSIIYVAAAPTFTSLTINGPASIAENRTGQYSATEWFSDGSSQVVIPSWNVSSTNASISAFGLLAAGEVSSNTPVVVSASYTDGVTLSVSNQVTVINLPLFTGTAFSQGKFQTTLSGLSIGQTVIFYGSSDLKVWAPIQTNTVSSGSILTFTNTSGSAISNQYFRAQVQ